MCIKTVGAVLTSMRQNNQNQKLKQNNNNTKTEFSGKDGTFVEEKRADSTVFVMVVGGGALMKKKKHRGKPFAAPLPSPPRHTSQIMERRGKPGACEALTFSPVLFGGEDNSLKKPPDQTLSAVLGPEEGKIKS